jgi:hypothetical protein
MNPNRASCLLEPDELLAKYIQSPARPDAKVFAARRAFWEGLPKHGDCSCGYRSQKRVCPRCHNELPSQFGELQNFIIALIGAKETGKSNYIGVLVRQLAYDVGSAFSAALNALDGRTTKRYNSDFKRYLYENRQIVPATMSSQTGIDVRYPLNYEFSLDGKGMMGRRRAIALSLFDTAGEDLDDQDVTTTHARYVAQAHGLIFLLDPLQLPAVREQLGNSVPMPQQRSDPKDIIDLAARIIRTSKNIPKTKKIPVPVGVAFSKIDAVRPLVEPNSPIHSASAHRSKYNESDGQRLHESMRSYLARWGGSGVDNSLRNGFEVYRYFGLSSLGYAPHNNNLTRGVVPFRVEDPFLWLLTQFGFIEKENEGGK